MEKRRILITGGAGFIGSHLTELLVEEGFNVRAFVRYNSSNSWGWLESLDKRIHSQIEVFPGDVRDKECVAKAAEHCNIILHLAALIGIPYSYYAPESYVDTNIKGTLNILNVAKTNSVEKVVITSTSEVYGTARYVPIDEKHPYQGQSPYSATKIGADRLAESYFRSFDTPVVIARPFNTFGPRQSARAIIPTIISQISSGVNELKLGNLYSTRDFVYVKDTARGFLELMKSEKTIGEEINIATNIEISMNEVANKIIELMDSKAQIVIENTRLRPEKSEVDRLLGSNDKILKLTNWKQKHSFEDGLKETINWFKKSDNLKYYKTNIYNI